MPKKMKMTGWYDPALLVQTGIRAAISTVFGRFADKREAIAAANAIAPMPPDAEFDYSAREVEDDFWFDYIADTGDGWNPTFAIARLVTEDSLAPARQPLPRGKLLILGGDQVYPTATPEDYQDRFRGPFDHAYAPRPGAEKWPEEKRPDLYAIPGNHDWYDGLNAFFGLFCRRRVARPGDLGITRRGAIIAGRQTRQTRSYFAIKLPGNWWLWGTDSQLEGYIDQPQIDYFQHAASYWMEANSRVILCVADPSWVYVDPGNPEEKFRSFSYLERLAGMALHPETGEPKGHQLKLVLTGDSHHYAHYTEKDQAEAAEPARHYLVCGGGGAFLHPTHQLKDVSFTYRYPKPGYPAEAGAQKRNFEIARKAASEEEALFPSRDESRSLAWRNLGFAWLNPKFVGVLAAAYLVFNWMLDFNARITGFGTLANALQRGVLWDSFRTYASLLVASPWPAILMAVAWGGYYYFADSPHSNRLRLAIGTAHALFQAAAVTFTILIVIRTTAEIFPQRWEGLISVLIATAASAIVSATAFGTYLLICLNLLGRHANEGFSSLRIENFKSFLRLRIARDGTLTIFPIGVRTVPNYRKSGSDQPLAQAHSIEGPITIR